MDLLNIIKMVAELGFITVAAAAFIKIAIDNHNKIQKNSDLLRDEYNKLVNDIISGVTGHYLSPEEDSKTTEIEKEIDKYMSQTLSVTNASRICFVRYHNGGKDMTGLPFLKMSMTNEICRPGVSPLMPDMQNCFRSLLSYWCGSIGTKGFCYIDNVEEIANKDAGMHDFLVSRGVQSTYGIAIKNSRGTTVGYLSIEYSDINDVRKDKIEECLKDRKIKIETLLSLKD